MAHRCSYCGQRGHKRPTCPELKSARNKPQIVFSQAPTPPFNIGDLVRSETGDEWTIEGFNPIAGPDVVYGTDGNGMPFAASQKALKLAESEATLPQSENVLDFSSINCWDLIEKVVPNYRTTLLYGPPGTGKTTAGNFAGNPSAVYNVTLTEETPAAEIRGHYVPRGGEFHWQDGPALKAYREGARLILNEIDKASQDCMTFCYALMDDESVSAITLPTGETVRPDPNFSVVATTNGVPEDLPDALRDRLTVRVYVPTPHPEAIKSLPADLRKPATKGFGKPDSPSFREWKAFAGLREAVGNEYAAKAVWGERAETVLNTLKIGTKAGLS